MRETLWVKQHQGPVVWVRGSRVQGHMVHMVHNLVHLEEPHLVPETPLQLCLARY